MFGASTGAINIHLAGGTGAATYDWSDIAGINDTEDRTGLTAGTYTVTVKDANGCTASTSATITQPASGLTVGSTQTNVLCFGASTGAINITAAGGTGAYTYDWSDIAGINDTEDRTGLAAGTYTVMATDANGCTVTASATITQPATGLTVAIDPVTNVACFGAASGSATAAAVGGTGLVTYVWSDAQTNDIAINLAAGTYTVTATDANGCTTAASVTITQPAAALSATISTTANATCSGLPIGSATVSTNGGTGTVTYLWSNGQTAATAINLGAGTYTVTATDANGCTATAVATITMSVPPALFTVTGGGSFCINDPGIEVGLSGSTVGFNYQLQVNAGNVGAALVGTGDALNFGLQTTVGTYTVVATTDAWQGGVPAR